MIKIEITDPQYTNKATLVALGNFFMALSEDKVTSVGLTNVEEWGKTSIKPEQILTAPEPASRWEPVSLDVEQIDLPVNEEPIPISSELFTKIETKRSHKKKPTAPPPPMTPVVPSVSFVPPAPVAPVVPVVPPVPVAPVVPLAPSVDTIDTVSKLINKMTELVQTKKLTQLQLLQTCAKFGLSSVIEICTHDELVTPINNELDILLGVK